MFEPFVEEILRHEGRASVVLIDMQSMDLQVWSDHWHHYTSDIPATEANAYELKESLEAAGFLVIVAERVIPPPVAFAPMYTRELARKTG